MHVCNKVHPLVRPVVSIGVFDGGHWGAGGHVPPQIIGPWILSGPESRRKWPQKWEKWREIEKGSYFFSSQVLGDGLISEMVHLIMFFFAKKLKKAFKWGNILSGPKCRWAHIDFCPPNSDVIKYAPGRISLSVHQSLRKRSSTVFEVEKSSYSIYLLIR